MTKKQFTAQEAKAVGDELGIKWDKFDVDQFCRGMDVELEHGTRDHLNEVSDYYGRLEEMEEEAEDLWGKNEK